MNLCWAAWARAYPRSPPPVRVDPTTGSGSIRVPPERSTGPRIVRTGSKGPAVSLRPRRRCEPLRYFLVSSPLEPRHTPRLRVSSHRSFCICGCASSPASCNLLARSTACRLVPGRNHNCKTVPSFLQMPHNKRVQRTIAADARRWASHGNANTSHQASFHKHMVQHLRHPGKRIIRNLPGVARMARCCLPTASHHRAPLPNGALFRVLNPSSCQNRL